MSRGDIKPSGIRI